MARSPTSLGSLLNSDADPGDSPEGRRAAKRAVKRWLSAIAAKDLAGLAETASADIVYEIMLTESGLAENGSHRRFAGIEAVKAFWQGTFDGGVKARGGFDDVELSITADGSRLFIEQRGDLETADGKSYRNRYVFRFDIRDDKVTHVREYFNPVSAAYAFNRPIAGKFIVEAL